MSTKAKKPTWDRLYHVASVQDGYFTTQQAGEAGYSTQLLLKHIRAGRLIRVRHGIYRLVHFPSGDHEELAVVWLWSERKGLFSHQTALGLHGLSDVMSARIHIVLPTEWRHRRFRVPEGVVLHHARVPKRDRAWAGSVPITSVRRTLIDCAKDQVSPDLLRQAAQQALRRAIAPGVGTAVGGFLGCAAGGFIGYLFAERAMGHLYDWSQGTLFRGRSGGGGASGTW